jgi:amino acid transporter
VVNCAPGVVERELLVAELDARPLVRRLGVRHGHRHRHVEVRGPTGQCRAEQRHDEPGVGGVQQGRRAVLGERGGDRLLVRGGEPDRAHPVVAVPLDDRPRPGFVVVGHHEALDELSPCGDGRHRTADPPGAHKEDSHWSLRVTTGRQDEHQERYRGRLVGEAPSCHKHRVTSADPPAAAATPAVELKHGAISFIDALVIGLASTSPAYSLAAVIGPIVALVGVYAPGVLLASFVPMLLIASAFYYLNKADQDCGTTFSWVTRAMGPWVGWIGGWAIAMTGVLVVGSLADTAVRFGLLTLGLDDLAANTAVVVALTVVVIVAMTAVCVIGTDVSARFQNVLILLQVLSLLVFAGVAIGRAVTGSSSLDALTPSVTWLNPFGEGGAALTAGLLLGVFTYWGWESAVNLTEETEDSASAPGRAAIFSTVVLLVTYLAVAYAVVSYAGTEFLTENEGEEELIFALLGAEVLGGWDWVLLLSVATSALASTQTTIIPASRTGLSMARRAALPHALAHIHPRFRTPDASTWLVAGIASAWYVLANIISENALLDTLTALSLLIAFYYALTGLACAVYYRRQLRHSLKSLLLIGIGPVVGALLLIWLLIRSVVDLNDPEASSTGTAWFGFGPPLVIGVVIFLLGVVIMVGWRLRDATFWTERPGVAPDPMTGDPAPGDPATGGPAARVR